MQGVNPCPIYLCGWQRRAYCGCLQNNISLVRIQYRTLVFLCIYYIFWVSNLAAKVAVCKTVTKKHRWSESTLAHL